MTLPRFTAGQNGSLEFHHLNEAFGYIDTRRSENPKQGPGAQQSASLVGRIGTLPPPGTPPSAQGYSWSEVRLTEAGEWIAIDGGRSSGPSNVAGRPELRWTYPAFALDGRPLDAFKEYLLVPSYRQDGKAFYLAMPQATTRPYQIIAADPIPTLPGQWRYSARLARRDFQGLWQIPNEQTFDLFNTLEALQDGVPANTFGVGSIKPASATVTRQPIKVGAVVVASSDLTGIFFSVPNGYGINCGQ